MTKLPIIMGVRPKPKPEKTSVKRRKKSKPSKISIDAADRFFSLCVRERADWTCECCGKKYEPEYTDDGLPKNMGLHCSHYYGRANKAVRWTGMNAWAHCYGCHSKFEGNPHNFKEWVLVQLGQEYYDLLNELSLSMDQGRENYRMRPQIGEYYKLQLERMMKERENGKAGRIEFVSW
jgi:hypothetical protein